VISSIMLELWMKKRERCGMQMRTMWKIEADMTNQGYDLPDWIGKTSYQ
jgi:hypothetical protein